MAKRKKMKNQPWRNDWVCVIHSNGETRKCYAMDERHMLIRFPEAVHRKWGFWMNMNTESQVKVGNNYWRGYAVCAKTGTHVEWELYFRGNRVRDAAQLLGQIGGQNGVGKRKSRGDSNYYNMLRMKGLEKRRKMKGNA